MKAVGYELDEIGKSSFHRNLAGNIVYWVAWQSNLPGTSSTFHLLGSPSIIFDRALRFGLVRRLLIVLTATLKLFMMSMSLKRVKFVPQLQSPRLWDTMKPLIQTRSVCI